MIAPATETRRWADGAMDPTKGIRRAYDLIGICLLLAGIAGFCSFYTTMQHSSELARQAAAEEANATFSKRICEMYERRDSAAMSHNAAYVAIQAKFASQLPKGYAAALNALASRRESDLFSIEKLDCNATITAPAPAPFSLSSP